MSSGLTASALRADLDARAQARLYRRRRLSESSQRPEVVVDGRRLLAFCSNDYLGLAAHPEVTQALIAGAERWGAGAGSAHLVNGHTVAHHALEEDLAELSGRPRALLFSTGYMANLGVTAALVGAGDRVYQDRLNHASLLDGAVLSRARFQRYQHGDVRDLERRLRTADGRQLIGTDGVFSMDGDLAPVPELVAVARRHGAWLMVDDAHGLGVLGNAGRGTLEYLGVSPEEVPVLVGTLGKAFGTFGAFVAGSEELIETVIQRARPYIYTTATPPAVAEATRVSLRIARREGWRREHLQVLIARFRAGCTDIGLPLMETHTPIQPLLVGTAAAAVHLAAALEERGLLITPIRPPTVPEGTARLRITLSAIHTEQHVDRLLAALEATAPATAVRG